MAVTFAFGFLLTTSTANQSQNVSGASCASSDVNGDGRIDSLDAQAVAFRSGQRVGDPLYDPRFDVNSDGIIDSADIAIVHDCLTLSTPVPAPSGPGNPCLFGVCKTALGDIPANPRNLAQKIATMGIGLAGGIALILMVIGSIRVLTSSGDQQRLAAGREMIIAALAGLLFLVFAYFILGFLAANVIGSIPGI